MNANISVIPLILGLFLGYILSHYKHKSKKTFSQQAYNLKEDELMKVKLAHSTLLEKSDQFKIQLDAIKKELLEQREKAIHYQTRLSEAQANYKHLEESLSKQKSDLESIQKRFSNQFENLANKIFEEKNSHFNKQNQEKLDLLLRPLGERLTEFKQKVEDTYSHESKERASLQGEIKKLFELNQTMATEAKNLSSALKGSSKTQGNWGELILETILEKSGLVNGREFETQLALTSEEGKRQHPDVILKLPNNRHMVIDSKVSLVAYERYYNAENEEKELALKDHIYSIRNHIKELSEKSYQTLYQINSPDFVLLFMPIEPSLGLAIQHDPRLFYDSLDKNVIIVTPSSLFTTLKLVANIWKQENQNKYALEIAQEGGKLYDKFVNFVDDLTKIGNQLKTTTDTYEKAMNKLSTGRGNLITRAEKIKKLGSNATKSLPEELVSDIIEVS